jgi:hypothetical protein
MKNGARKGITDWSPSESHCSQRRQTISWRRGEHPSSCARLELLKYQRGSASVQQSWRGLGERNLPVTEQTLRNWEKQLDAGRLNGAGAPRYCHQERFALRYLSRVRTE